MTVYKHFLCGACHRVNRVPAADLGKRVACGRCDHLIDQSSTPVNINDALLDSLIAKSPVPLLVDFWAPWCGPCKAFAPQLAELARSHAGQLLVVKVNTDDFKANAGRLGIQSIPTLALFKNGELKRLETGVPAPAALRDLVAPYLTWVS